MVFSAFNCSKVELSELDDRSGFTMIFQVDELKLQQARVFHSSLGVAPAADRSQLDVLYPERFDGSKINVSETKTRIKVLLPRKGVKRMQMTRVRGD
mmetsp:Transcript_15133/g.40662  ORF Transcript_15133/g.40662 Transcript_15133/m.40662 type:complete len:97 (+) Transcript_15133:409-699(+)